MFRPLYLPCLVHLGRFLPLAYPLKLLLELDWVRILPAELDALVGEMQVIIPDIIPEPDVSWLRLPAERSAAFLPTFARISVALQSALRERVPPLYFHSLERFDDWKSAYPMLVYQASRPFRGRVRSELTYDVLNPRLMALLFRRARTNMVSLLEQAEARLLAGGRSEEAAHYSSKRAPEILQSVQRLSAPRRCLYRLVRSEGVLVEAMVDLSGSGALTVKEQARRLVAFRRKWQYQLRRLYPRGDFSELAPALLEAATHAWLSVGDSGADPDPEAGGGFTE